MMRMLELGGNALDAAVANGLALQVLESFGSAVLDDLIARGHRITVADAWTVGRLTVAKRGDNRLLSAAATPRLMQAYAIGR